MLADTYGLYLKTHSFHWNVEGPMFNTLHLMFMTQYTELWNALDDIAERIRSLGYPAPGTNTQFAKLTSIDETDGVPEAMEMVRLLTKGHKAVARTARDVLPAADKGGDESTTDLLTQRLQIHEKTAWMLRSMLKLIRRFLGRQECRCDPKDGMDSAEDVEIRSLKLIGLHMDLLEAVQIKRHRLTVGQFDRMKFAGVFSPDVRVELIEGQVVEMALRGSRQRAAVNRLCRLLMKRSAIARSCRLSWRFGWTT